MKIVAVLGPILLCSLAGERSVQVTSGGQTIEIRLSSEGSSVSSTVVVFPEESIQTIISGWTAEELSAVNDTDKLFLRLMSPKSGYLDVIGSSGFLYRLYIKSVAADKSDTYVKLEKATEAKQYNNDALDLMRAMRLGKKLDGAKIIKYEGDPLYRADWVKVYVLYQYNYGFYKGFILKVENHGTKSYEVDLSRFRGDNLIMIGATSYLVSPGNKGYIFCVFYR